MLIGAKKSLQINTNNPQPLAGNIITAPYAMDDIYWVNNANITVTANATLAPDGTSLADLCVPNGTGSAAHEIARVTGGVGTTTNVDWVVRLRIKPAGYSCVWFILGNSLGYTKQCQVLFDASSLTVRKDFFATYIARPSIRKLSGGWFLCEMNVSAIDANITHVLEFRIEPSMSTASYSGDLVSGMYLWGAEFAPAV